jgi:hypothetical protein
MAFDQTVPAGSKKIRLSDELIRANWAALETAISEGHEFATGGNQTGKHVTPTWKDNGGAPASDPSGNERKLYNNGGTMKIRDNGGTDHILAPIELNTVMVFKQNSAPTKWTFKSEDNDRTLLNTSTESEGGDTGGTWTISGFGGTTDGHTLTVSEIPAHDHDITCTYNTGASGSVPRASNSSATTGSTESTGGGGSHSHDISDTNMSHDGSWRPSYVKVITCTKD